MNEITSALELAKEQEVLLKKQSEMFDKMGHNISKMIEDYDFATNLLHKLNNYDTELFTRCSDMIGMFAEMCDYSSNDLEDLIADLNERLGR